MLRSNPFAPHVPFRPVGAMALLGGLTGPAIELARDASIFLLVGGLAVLFLVISLVLLQSLVPARGPMALDDASPVPRKQLRPIGAPVAPLPEPGRRPRARETQPRARVDLPVDQIIRLHLGEPRILRHQPHYTLLRLYGCRSCRPGAPSRPVAEKHHQCAFERGQIEDAFRAFYPDSVLVRETACTTVGASVCEFEVRH